MKEVFQNCRLKLPDASLHEACVHFSELDIDSSEIAIAFVNGKYEKLRKIFDQFRKIGELYIVIKRSNSLNDGAKWMKARTYRHECLVFSLDK